MNKDDFYVFEVLEKYEDKLLCYSDDDFYKGTRFIGYEDKSLNCVVKSNMEELVMIPLSKVKKVMKINFEEIKE